MRELGHHIGDCVEDALSYLPEYLASHLKQRRQRGADTHADVAEYLSARGHDIGRELAYGGNQVLQRNTQVNTRALLPSEDGRKRRNYPLQRRAELVGQLIFQRGYGAAQRGQGVVHTHLISPRLHEHLIVPPKCVRGPVVSARKGVHDKPVPLCLCAAGRELGVEFLLAYAYPVERISQHAGNLPDVGSLVCRLDEALNRQRVAECAGDAGGDIRPVCDVLLVLRELCKQLRGLRRPVVVAEDGIKPAVSLAGCLCGEARVFKRRIQPALRLPVFLRRLVEVPERADKIRNGGNCRLYGVGGEVAYGYGHCIEPAARFVRGGAQLLRGVTGVVRSRGQVIHGLFVFPHLAAQLIQLGLRFVYGPLPLLCPRVGLAELLRGLVEHVLLCGQALFELRYGAVEDVVLFGERFNGFALCIGGGGNDL